MLSRKFILASIGTACIIVLTFTIMALLQDSSSEGIPEEPDEHGECPGPWHGIHPGNMVAVPKCPPSNRTGADRRFAYVTMILTAKYLVGLEKLLCSMRKVNTKYPLVAVIPLGFDPEVTATLHSYGVDTIEMELLMFPNKCLKRFEVNWTKLKMWTLEQYDKLVVLDADTFLVQNIDDLFDIQYDFSVAGDIDRYVDCKGCGPLGYNQAGLFTIRPCKLVYEEMLSIVRVNDTLQFRYADAEQGFFNWYFYFSRNLLPASYNFLPELWADSPLRQWAKVYHFTLVKPWGLKHREYHTLWHQCNEPLNITQQ